MTGYCSMCGKVLAQHSLHQLRVCADDKERLTVDLIHNLEDAAERKRLERQLR